MEWRDRAIVLGARKHGETSLIVSLLTESHGKRHGLARGGARSRQRGVYEPGNLVTAYWQARLAEHLGLLRLDSEINIAAPFMADPLRLGALEAATALADLALPDQQSQPATFAALAGLLDHLRADSGYALAHLHWEVLLLADLGYGLDLARCAVTGQSHDLAFVSPRTGRAISAGAAGAWRDRLLALPRALGGTGAGGGEVADLLDGLALTGGFLDRLALAPRGKTLPAARQRYMDRLGRLAAISGGHSEGRAES
jgi:DNA repair protein RecO (recombination protein O)